MRRFTVYRRDVTPGSERFDERTYNRPDLPQVEGVVFHDGRVACRWMTNFKSTVAWESFDDFHAVHIGSHPDYGTEIVWHDGEDT